MDDDSEPTAGRRSLRPRNAQGRAASSDNTLSLRRSTPSKASANNTDVIDLSDLSDSPEDDNNSDNSDVEFVPNETEVKKLSKGKRSSPSSAGKAISNAHNGGTSASTSEEFLGSPSTSKGGKTNVSKIRTNKLSNKLVPNNHSQNNNGIPPMVLIAQNRHNNPTSPANIVKFTMLPSSANGALSTVAPAALLVNTANSNQVLIPVTTTNAGLNIVGSSSNPSPFVTAQIQANNIATRKDNAVKMPAKTYSKTETAITKPLSAKRSPAEQIKSEPFEKVRMVYIKCEECGSEFHLRESYYSHIKHDHCKKPYRCLLRNCLVGFDEQSEYNEHVKTRHQFLTAYNCARCPQVFTSYDYLTNHEELCHVTGLFQCSYCTLTSTKRMTVHMHHLQRHHHICHDCARSFPSKNDLKIHTKAFHPSKQTIVVPAHQTIPVKQQLKQTRKHAKQTPQSPIVHTAVAPGQLVETNLPPLPPEPEESFCDPSRLLDVRLKEEELDEDVQVIRHPKKRKADGEIVSTPAVSQPAVLPTVAPSTLNESEGAPKTRYIVLRRPDGTEQMVALGPGVNLPTNTGNTNGPPQKVMVVVQKSTLNKDPVNGGQPTIVASLVSNASTAAVEEPLEDAINEQKEESGNYTVVKLNCFARCSKEFTSYQELLTHMDEVHCILPFRCLHRGCGRSFGSLLNLNRHVVYHAKSSEKFRCSYCDLTYLRHRELADHLFIRHELGEFACASAGCTYRSISRGLIDEHFKKEHVLCCAVSGCKATFKDQNAMEDHEKTHDNFRRFYCKMFHADKEDSAACTFQSANKEEMFTHVKKARDGADQDINMKDYVGIITGWHPKTIKRLLFEEDVIGAEEVEISKKTNELKEQIELVEANNAEKETATNSTNEAMDTGDDAAAPAAEKSGETSNENETAKVVNAPTETEAELPSAKASDALSAEVNENASANNEPTAETNIETEAMETNETPAGTNDIPLAEADEHPPAEISEPGLTVDADAPT